MNDGSLSVSIAEALAKYFDSKLRKSTKEVVESDLEQCLEDGVQLFKYLDDKDVFQKFYARLLAKRLIYNLSTSDDAEASAITRLKNACGLEYTSKLQRMFTDMSVSQDLSVAFRDHIRASATNAIDTSVLVLTQGAWPMSQSQVMEVIIPEELEHSARAFTDFYQQRYNGRRLTWLHHLSKVEVRAWAFDKRYDLTVSIVQFLALLALNSTDVLSITTMARDIKMSEPDLQRALKPLVEIKLLLQADTGYRLNFCFKKYARLSYILLIPYC